MDQPVLFELLFALVKLKIKTETALEGVQKRNSHITKNIRKNFVKPSIILATNH